MTEKQLLKSYLIKRDLYKLVSLLTLFIGFILFIAFYVKYVNGNPGLLAKQPTLLLYILMPFMPSIFFLYLSTKAQDKFQKARKDQDKTE